MKNNILLLLILTTSATVSSQNSNKCFGLYIGGGSQRYSGDLGNGINLKQNTWRGGFTGLAMFYLNRSFDIGTVGYIGDLGFCQSDAVARKEVPVEERCGGGGCIGRVGLGNLSSRIISGGLVLKYKLNNNYILREEVRIQPYLFTGISTSKVTDRMNMNCVNVGRYYAINTGLGFRYPITKNFNIGYNATLGYFTTDNIDFMQHDGNDMYLQNNILFGFEF